MVILLVFLAFAYLFLITHFVSGWKRLPEQKTDDIALSLYLTVIVPFRDEEQNLTNLLNSLKVQTYSQFQLILIDDHSKDNSYAIANSYLDIFPDLLLLKANSEGKKKALRQAIDHAKGELIVCTDADCVFESNWLKSIAEFQKKEQADFLVGPVKMTYGKDIFTRLQALEFISLVASGAGAIGVGIPILCNGANMAFTPTAWEQNGKNITENEASGDDMFLMMSVKKNGGKIGFLKSKDALVSTYPNKSLSEFLNQRKRWVSKSKSYRDWQVIAVAGLVFCLNLFILLACFVGIFNVNIWSILLVVWLLKMLVDACLLIQTADFFSIKRLLVLIPLLSVIYPFYVLYSFFAGAFGQFKWKN